jgi:chromosome segregation protein
MKIKKVAILGFKSFMDRLEIAFPDGISGVVGPNGCGKSNIIDAIRWCMGEQSPKELRGRRMEDIIFNGAGKYKPLGMAEVSILFENGNGSLPESLSHDSGLAVTRRIYRSGESEYLMNNVPCRLKDIHEILMDTGLGNRAYSIIGQGRIEMIVGQRPEETRLMLEEAAGVTKYRKKALESCRKIELTEANLQRVEDILGEIKSQMRSLQRQAARAKKYKAVCSEIQDLEMILYSNSYHQLLLESGSKLTSTEGLLQQELSKSTDFSRARLQLDSMNIDLATMDDDLSGLRNKHARMNERINRKKAEIDSLAAEIKTQLELKDRLKNEKEETIRRVNCFKEDRTGLEAKLAEAKKGMALLDETIIVAEKRVKNRQGLMKDLKAAHEEARIRLNDVKNRETGLSHESGYINKTLNQITTGRTRLEGEIREIRAKIDDVLRVSEKKNAVREALGIRFEDIKAAIVQKNDDLDELEQSKEKVEADLKTAEASLNRWESRLSSLQSLAEGFEGYGMGVRTIMKAKDTLFQQPGRITGLLADVIQVEPQYETAVEMALGDKLQYIITKSRQDARIAVDFLKEKQKGRGSFVPFEEMKEKNKKMSPLKEAVAGFSFLSDLVQVPSEYQWLMECLLSDTIIVKDLNAALSAWEETGGAYCFVTFQGDRVDQRGIITGGRLIESRRGLLARRREIAELEKKTADCRVEVKRLKVEFEEIVGALNEARKNIEDLTEERWDCQEEITGVDKTLFRFAQELDQMEKTANRLVADLRGKDHEKTKHEETLLKIESELDRRRSERTRVEKNFHKKEIELRECDEEFNRIREEVSRLKSESHVYRNQTQSLNQEIGRVAGYIDTSLKRIQEIDEEVLKGQDRRAECETIKASIKDDQAALFEMFKKSEALVNLAEQKRQTHLINIKGSERTIEQLHKDLSSLKEQVSASRMEQSEIAFKMKHLTEIVREKFNQELESVYKERVTQDIAYVELEEKISRQKRAKQKLGEVNLTAIKEHEVLKDRYEFLKKQQDDLVGSIEDLKSAITKINRTSLMKFKQTFEAVDQKLKEIFPILFKGGTAGLILTDEDRPLEGGVIVKAQPPGKKLSYMGLLSGGEKALVAMALIFAIYMIKPSPFCLLDEVDAPLDEANLDRFNDLLKEIKKMSQVIMITHNRKSMEISDRLFGVTMENMGVSKLVSVDIEKFSANDAAGQRIMPQAMMN